MPVESAGKNTSRKISYQTFSDCGDQQINTQSTFLQDSFGTILPPLDDSS